MRILPGGTRIQRLRSFAFLAVILVLVASCDWAQLGYTSAGTRYNPTETAIGVGNVGTLTSKWTATAGAEVYSSPSVKDGVAYVTSSGELYAVDTSTGVLRWTSSGVGVTSSSPAEAYGLVYVGGEAGLYGFDAAGVSNCSGTPKTCGPVWSARTDGDVVATPTVTRGVVYIVSTNGALYAFDAATGARLWTATGLQYDSTPAVANGVVYVAAGANLYAFDAAGVTNCSGHPRPAPRCGLPPEA